MADAGVRIQSYGDHAQRKVTDTLLGFEVRLKHRVSFVARCFHAWHFQAKLDRTCLYFEHEKSEWGIAKRQDKHATAARVKAVVLALVSEESTGSVHICFKSWRREVARVREGKALKHRAGGAVRRTLRALDEELLSKYVRCWSDEVREARRQKELEELQAQYDLRCKELEVRERLTKRKSAGLAAFFLARAIVGDDETILRTTLREWKFQHERSMTLRRSAEIAKCALLKAVEGDRRLALREAFVPWKRFAVSRPARTEPKPILPSGKLLKYICFFGTQDLSTLRSMVFSGWFYASCGRAEKAEFERRQHLQMVDMARQHAISVSKHQREKAWVLSIMGAKGDRVHLQVWFKDWAVATKLAGQYKAHAVQQNAAVQRFAQMLNNGALQGDTALLEAYFAGWRRETASLRREREVANAQKGLNDLRAYALRLEDDRTSLQEQLSQAYQQIELVSATLQKELLTKGELAGELRSAYDRLRSSAAAAAAAGGALQQGVPGCTSRVRLVNDAAVDASHGMKELPKTPSTHGPLSFLSRNSSEQTLQLHSSPRMLQAK